MVDRLTRIVQSVRRFGNEVAQIRVKWLLASGLLFLGSVVMTQLQFQDQTAQKREQVVADSKSRDYILELGGWTTNRVIYDACLVSVNQSEGNRAWKTWLLDKLEETFPESPEADSIVAEGREKLDELVPAIDPATCIDPGPVPTPPFGSSLKSTP